MKFLVYLLCFLCLSGCGGSTSSKSVENSSPSVSGKVSTSGGTAVAGAVVMLTGSSSSTTTTDSNGIYRFTAVNNGTYQVTAAKTGYFFTPSVHSVTVGTADVIERNFTAADSNTGPATLGSWTWVSGDSTVNRVGTYGAKGVASPLNCPGARGGAMSWSDKSGNLWLFGGYGIDSTGTTGHLNDLWKFDGANWTWVAGGNLSNRSGAYGTKGVPAGSNEPGARDCGSTWTDAGGNLWLFGGIGKDANGVQGYLGDLWKFDGTAWTWVSGDTTADGGAVYGLKGFPSATNKPGAREAAVAWVDRLGRLWLFGGSGKDAAGVLGHLNELWCFDGAAWTWVSGTTIANDLSDYGTLGLASPSNAPWGRDITKTWVDPQGDAWFFGGCTNHGLLSDLWKFDGGNWTWVSGSNVFNSVGIYGNAATARPGARSGSIFWMDSNGCLWLYGGFGVDGGYNGEMNDLWKFDGVGWKLIAGNGTSNQSPVYGTKGSPSAANTPARIFGSASWVVNGTVWAFGGYVPGGMTNVLWKYAP
ncbi:carboxypeptidase regulatory-like domain-containing protein [Geomonas nitrogeniifigens]|uniref:Carboxypeptidase regulatory-like domain-containing protein n=1 Tax=Geomonas diazotrophica TaxID=2843197 RepID=A0ABX8JK05_9BACT|nr:kelch repeat-containing protein [Geomonas nitrogeniifigens]QWV98719.1 carboxypeptidase regulatory-like domain-containing protein [Geomonas nitrogeniifigens]QXE87876.1 carboxypeptidase regulatory-like domain-containing protein [Geomonas nitrogeniifigens]